jgi:hypothetical protein
MLNQTIATLLFLNEHVMKKLMKSLPALGLALAATMAFAFNMPNNQRLFAINPDTGQEIEVTHLRPGVDYDCDPGNVCTYDEDGNPVMSGTFVWLD